MPDQEVQRKQLQRFKMLTDTQELIQAASFKVWLALAAVSMATSLATESGGGWRRRSPEALRTQGKAEARWRWC